MRGGHGNPGSDTLPAMKLMTSTSVIGLGVLLGCAAAPATDRAEPPRDFALAVTVYAPADRTATATRPAATRPARYLLEPDGLLRVALGPGAGDATYPDATRTLTSTQVAALWNDVRGGPWLSPDAPGRIGSTQTFVPPPGQTVYLITVTGDGQRRSFTADPRDRGASAIVNRLAALSWLP